MFDNGTPGEEVRGEESAEDKPSGDPFYILVIHPISRFVSSRPVVPGSLLPPSFSLSLPSSLSLFLPFLFHFEVKLVVVTIRYSARPDRNNFL